jgi:hypothetical protein
MSWFPGHHDTGSVPFPECRIGILQGLRVSIETNAICKIMLTGKCLFFHNYDSLEKMT